MMSVSPQPTPSPVQPVLSRLQPRPPDRAKPTSRPTPSTPVRSASGPSNRSTVQQASLSTISGKDTSSSSGKVFAKPSKEWILPERVKPGRKINGEEPNNKRQSQNRQSQRAHRARRTDYMQTLEDRLRQYEADEIHSNVRLQEVARALKADNEKLRNEVAALKLAVQEGSPWAREKADLKYLLADLQNELNSTRVVRGILQNELHNLRVVRGMPALVVEPTQHVLLQQQAIPPLGPPPFAPLSPAPRGPLKDCPICPDPDPDCPCQEQQQPGTTTDTQTQIGSTSLSTLTLAAQTVAQHGESCGLCHSEDDCLCRVVENKSSDVNVGCGLCTTSSVCACEETTITTAMSPHTAAIPLRRGPRSNQSRSRIWAINTSSNASEESDAVCSSDPSNCDACRNDTFGRKFCSDLLDRPISPCQSCSGDCMSIKSLLCAPDDSQAYSSGPSATDDPRAPLQISCRGDLAMSGHGDGGRSGEVIGSDLDSDGEIYLGKTMRPDQAWKSLKAHPNAEHTSLSLLADVVARRTRCVGPRIQLSPEPGSRKRTLEVETSAVRDALRILDERVDSERKDKGAKRKRP